MKITFKQVVLRVAAATGLLVSASVVACSGTNDPANPTPGPGTAGTNSSAGGMTSMAGTSSGGASAGTGTGGSGGASKCPGNEVMQMGMCSCPAYAPLLCEAITKCVSPMKDPDHCGDCMTTCGAMNACSLGKCTPDLMPFADITGCGTLELLSTATKLYVLGTMTGLSSIDLPAGGAPKPITATLMGGTAFAVDATNAYVAAGMDLKRVKLADGTTDTLVSAAAKIFDVAVDGMGNVYYATGKDIMQVATAATAPAMSTGVSVAVSADEGTAEGVAVSAGTVLYASDQAFNLESDPVVDPTTGDGHVKIGASQAGLIFGHHSVQADATNVYWANGGLQTAKFGGADHTASTVASPIDGSPIIAYAIDGAKAMAYLATKDGSFEKSAFAAGNDEATWVARAIPTVSSIVLDDASVYLASECKILKSAR